MIIKQHAMPFFRSVSSFFKKDVSAFFRKDIKKVIKAVNKVAPVIQKAIGTVYKDLRSIPVAINQNVKGYFSGVKDLIVNTEKTVAGSLKDVSSNLALPLTTIGIAGALVLGFVILKK